MPSTHSPDFPSTAAAVEQLYVERFRDVSQQKWGAVLSVDTLFDAASEIYAQMAKGGGSLQQRQMQFENAGWDDSMMSFLDLVKMLNMAFAKLYASLTTVAAGACVHQMVMTWPLTVESGLLRPCKGLAGHMAEDKERAMAEKELSCLLLRPVMKNGIDVIHRLTDQVGTVVATGTSDSPIIWRPRAASSDVKEEDPHALLAIHPSVSRADCARPLPPITKADLMREFREIYPYGKERAIERVSDEDGSTLPPRNAGSSSSFLL